MTSSEPELWIVIRNWERFQHYGNRRPSWVKIYLDLLHDPNWLRLTPSARAVLLGVWLLYASGRRALPLSTAYLSRALQMRVTSEHLKSLNHAGFIEFVASKPLALTRSRDLEVEKYPINLETFAVARENETQDDGDEPVENEWKIPDELWRMP